MGLTYSGGSTNYTQLAQLGPIVNAYNYFTRDGQHDNFQSIITQCSADVAFSLLRVAGNSAPGAPYAREGTHLVTLTGNNPIEQTVNSSARTIVNETVPGHMFHHGTVTFRVTSIDGGYSLITSTGTGTGMGPEINNFAGVFLFGQTLQSIENYCGVASGR